jgi:hypothetical protein
MAEGSRQVLHPESCSGLPFSRNIVRVGYFDDAGAMDRMHRDLAHARLESIMYASAAAAASLRIVASATPRSRQA